MSNYINNEKYIKLYNSVCRIKITEIPKYRLPASERIIVIGDIHGDLDILIIALKLGKVIDNNNKWIGGETIVVQLGDQIDSCRPFPWESCKNPNTTLNDLPNDIEILKFMTDLHQRAILSKGAVISLMGNHELMNVEQNFANVSSANIKIFNELRNNIIINNGLENRKKMFSPGNTISNFLGCTRYTTIIIGSILFVHGGILSDISDNYQINDINILMSLYLFNALDDKSKEHYDKIFNNTKVNPLWTREYNTIKDNRTQCNELLNKVLCKYNVKKIIVGHTPKLNEDAYKCDNRIIFADSASSFSFDKHFKYKREITQKLRIFEILNDGDNIKMII